MRRLLMRTGPLFAVAFIAGCHTDMWVQNKVHKPYQKSAFFADKQSSRPRVPYTVPQGELRTDREMYTGIIGGTRVPIDIRSGSPVQTGIFRGTYVDKFPFAITRQDLLRGQAQFDAFCSPCHGRAGDGNGMIGARGFNLQRKPANYHTDRLRQMPIGHFYDVITNGYGVMYGYASRIEVKDRWRIVAYIRALQLAQGAPVSELSAVDRERLNEAVRAGGERP
ncbi:MAG: cytochrome c [Fimbriimonadia bacterium]